MYQDMLLRLITTVRACFSASMALGACLRAPVSDSDVGRGPLSTTREEGPNARGRGRNRGWDDGGRMDGAWNPRRAGPPVVASA